MILTFLFYLPWSWSSRITVCLQSIKSCDRGQLGLWGWVILKTTSPVTNHSLQWIVSILFWVCVSKHVLQCVPVWQRYTHAQRVASTEAQCTTCYRICGFQFIYAVEVQFFERWNFLSDHLWNIQKNKKNK